MFGTSHSVRVVPRGADAKAGNENRINQERDALAESGILPPFHGSRFTPTSPQKTIQSSPGAQPRPDRARLNHPCFRDRATPPHQSGGSHDDRCSAG
jgi:hypothetical protein